MTVRSIFLLPAAALVLTTLTVGCSSYDGPEAASEVEDVNAGGICAQAATWSEQCASAKVACDDAILETCAGVASLLNESVLDAATTCLEQGACGASPTTCLARSIAHAETRESHKVLAQGFCSCLPTGKSACIEGIRAGEGPAMAALSTALPLGDELAAAITDACTTTPGCSATFGACAQGVIAKKLAETLSAESATCIAKSVLEAGTSATSVDDHNGSAAEEKEKSEGTDEEGASCMPKTCDDLGETCGSHPDGCFGMLDCGACATACQPKTCAQLAKSCGTHADGCGGMANCGACAATCSADAWEGNDTAATAKSIGAMSDSPDSGKYVQNLTLPDGDADWFRTKISDDGLDGNPYIKATTSRALEVSVFYVCDGGGDASYCPNSVDKADGTIGKGCRGTTSAGLKTSCSGLTDSGTAYIRVRKLASDGQCVSYRLDVDVQ